MKPLDVTSKHEVFPPNLQNQSHHKQAGRENGISVAVRKREEESGEGRKESGAL